MEITPQTSLRQNILHLKQEISDSTFAFGSWVKHSLPLREKELTDLPATRLSASPLRSRSQRLQRVTFLSSPIVKGELGSYIIFHNLTHEDAETLFKQTGKEVAFKGGELVYKNFTLGKGAFGTIYLAQNSKEEFLALKETIGEKATAEEGAIQKALTGLPNVLPLIDQGESWTSDGQKILYHFFPLAGLGSTDPLRKNFPTLDPQFREDLLTHLAKNLLTGLAAIHAKGYAHLDIKPDNLLLNNQGELLIADFGVTTPMEDGLITPSEVGGTEKYFSPERRGVKAPPCSGAAVDAWAVGITLIELAAGYPSDVNFHLSIFVKEDPNPATWHHNICTQCFNLKLIPLESPAPGSIWAIIRALIDPNPKTRLTPQKALNCLWAKIPPAVPQYLAELIQYKERAKNISLTPQTLPLPQLTSYQNRPSLEKALKNRLQKPGLTPLVGPGGAGKSKLASYALHTFSNTPTKLWFNNADTPFSLDTQYLLLAREWGLATDKTSPKEAVSFVHKALNKKPYTIVFDNAGDCKTLFPYLPQGEGYTIITTRVPWEGGLSIGTLNQEESLVLIKKLLQKEDPQALSLAQRLGHLPLALIQACAYIRNQNETIASYLTLLNSQPQTFLDKKSPLYGKEFPESLLSLTEATFAKLPFESLDLLHKLAFLASPLPHSLALIFGDQASLTPCLNYSLITSDATIYTLHPLVQEIARLHTPPATREPLLEILMKTINGLYRELPKDARERAINLTALSHSRLLNTHAERLGVKPTPALRDSLFEIASMERFLGNPRALISLLERVVTLTESLEGEKDPEMATCLISLGEAYRDLGDAERAIDYYKRALAIDEATYGKEHPNVARDLNSLGLAYCTSGDAKGAISYLTRALAIGEAAYGKEHPNVAIYLNGLGLAYRDLGDAKGAISYYERALAIDEATYGKEHFKVAIRLGNLGGAYEVLRDTERAIGYYKRALAIDEATYGKEHPEVATGLNNLGNAYLNSGDTQGAIGYYKRALAIDEAAYGNEHPSVAIYLNGLGHAYFTLGDTQGAIGYFKRALAIGEAAYGKEHPKLAVYLNSLGGAYQVLGDAKEAIGCYERALALSEAAYGTEHPEVAVALHNLGSTYEKLRDVEQAIRYYKRALAIDEVTYGKDHPDVVRDLSNLGIAYYTLGDAEGAVCYLEQALAIDEATYGKDHPNVAIYLNNLGKAYRALGDAKKAIGYLERALPAFEIIYGKEHHNVGALLSSLGSAYEALGDTQGAIGYYERALAIVYSKEEPNVRLLLKALGAAYQASGDTERAICYLEQALAIFEITYGKEHSNVGTLLSNLGAVYQASGDTKRAICCLERALAIFEITYSKTNPSKWLLLSELNNTYNAAYKAPGKESEDMNGMIDWLMDAAKYWEPKTPL